MLIFKWLYRNRTRFSLYKMCCHYTNNLPLRGNL
nr:MAG TPA: hypothetical protein [Caudoviricetes sp.]